MPQTIAITPLALRDENNEVAVTLKERGFRVLLHPHMVPPQPAEQRALLADAAGVILGPEPLTRELMEAAPNLKVVSRYGVGYDNIDVEAATDMGIVVTYVPDAMVDAVADLTMGLLLAAARRIPELDGLLKAGEWRRLMAADVTGRTLGLVGTGRIGMAVARRARAFRMPLLGHDPCPNSHFVEELGGRYVDLDELLESADFVSLHLPVTAGTRHLLNRERLGKMKPTAYLINCARGTLVDETALLGALRSGALAGAATDVFSEEPPSPGSPAAELARHPGLVATPHVASMTPLTVARMGRAALANLLQALEGRRPEHLVNAAVYERGARLDG